MTLYDKTVEFVDQAFKGKQKKHFERTVYWMEKLYPAFTEAHRIAAYSHDIEGGINGRSNKYLDTEMLKNHQDGGAVIMEEFLRKEGATEDMINKVKHLISKHEFGGDKEQNALKDADSISFLEVNAERFVRERASEDGYEVIKEKLDWMFNRITSSVAKEAAKENYEKWRGELERFKHSTKQAIQLCQALEGKGIIVEPEHYDGHKHVDIFVPQSKLYIEVEGLQHYTDPKQILADFKRDYYSDHEGFATFRVTNQLIDNRIDEIVLAIAEIVKERGGISK